MCMTFYLLHALHSYSYLYTPCSLLSDRAHTGLTLPFPSERRKRKREEKKEERREREREKKIDRVRIKRWENRKLIALASR